MRFAPVEHSRNKDQLMIPMRNIIFPIDFSDACKAAAPYIADIRDRFDAELHLLHVVEQKHPPPHVFAQRSEELKAFACLLPGGGQCNRIVTYGNAAQAIVSYARAHGADLIAMPTSGKGTLCRWIIGSTAEAVLQRAPCAVWAESGTGVPHSRWSPVLCAIDLKQNSQHVLRYAARIAETLGANLFVVHAIPETSEGLLAHSSHLPVALSEGEAERRLHRLLAGLDLYAETLINRGTVESVVSRAARQIRAKLLVIGPGGEPASAAGMHTYDLVRGAPCPVLTCGPLPPATHSFWTEWQQELVSHKDR
jgi:nucleotide-binding universal stress UspA family protein